MIPAGMRRNVDRMIRKYGGGTITLTRSTPGGSTTPYVPGPATTAVFTLSARVDGATNYTTDATIKATDLVVIASPKATDADGATVDIVPRMSDVLHVDGLKKAVKKIDPVPAAGTPARFHIFVGS